MRILFISLGYHPEIGGNTIIASRVTADLAEMGHEVHVVTGFPYHGLAAPIPEYRGRYFMREMYKGVHVHRAFNYTSTSKSIVAKILNQFSFVFSSILSAMAAPKPDVIFVMSPPLLLGATGFVVSMLRRVPFIYNAQDIHPQCLIDVGFLKKKSSIKFWEAVEGFVYRRAFRIVCICDAARNFLQAVKKVPASKLDVLENFTDTEHVKVLPRENRFREKHGLSGKFVVLSAGTMSMTQDLDVALDAAALLRDEKDIHFLIVGGGTQRDRIAGRLAEMSLPNVTMLPFQPEDEMPEMMAAADLCLVNTKKAVTIVSMPSKIFGIISAARPILATVAENSAAADYIKKAGCGLVAEPENPEKMKEAVLYFYRNPEEARQMGAAGRRYVESNNSRRVIAGRYDSYFRGLDAGMKNKNQPKGNSVR